MKIIYMGLASGLHGREYYAPLYGEVVDNLSRFKNISFLDEPLTSYVEMDLNKYDLVIIHHLTGGTSGLAVRLAGRTTRPVILVASGPHNALASALSAREKIRGLNRRVKLLYYSDLDDLFTRFERVYRGLSTADLLKNLKILEVNETGENSATANYYMERVGGLVESVGFKEVLEMAENTPSNALKQYVREISEYIDVSSADKEYLEKTVRIYYALRDIVEKGGYRAVAIDCFPLILKYKATPCLAVAMLNARGIPTSCEDDFYSLPLLVISKYLAGKPGWIANPSGTTREGYLRFAHCTIAPNLGSDCYLVDHFETGEPYAVTCRYGFREVVYGRLSSDYKVLRIYRGRVVESGLLDKSYCRTQLLIDPSPMKPEEFIREAIGNHHVFIPYVESFMESLEYLAWWMNWRLEVRSWES